MPIQRLLQSDGTLSAFESDWTLQCELANEQIDDYGGATMPLIRQHAQMQSAKEWAIALLEDGEHRAAACATQTVQKGYSGVVLRIREVTVCPKIDCGLVSEKTYADTLIGFFAGAVNLSDTHLVADHVKFHLPSPADAMFFRAFGNTLGSKGVFKSVEAHGSWLVITK